jgi:hypothetical protein
MSCRCPGTQVNIIESGAWHSIFQYQIKMSLFRSFVLSELINHKLYLMIILIISGYFIYDFLDLLINHKLKSNWEVVLHHVIVSIGIISQKWFKAVPYTSGKIWTSRLIFLFFFGSVFEYIHCNKYQNFNKFQPTDSEL